ncbi:hypothetical protein ES703_51183 [subsurface metagenome]
MVAARSRESLLPILRFQVILAIMKDSSGAFRLVEYYLGIRMGLDLATISPGEPAVVETTLRLRRETGYGYIRACWWFKLKDGRSGISVPPGTAEEVRKIVQYVSDHDRLSEPAFAEKLKTPVNAALLDAGLREVDRRILDVNFACDAMHLRRHNCGDCQRLTDESIPPAGDMRLPTQCFSDGVVFGVIGNGQVVSMAFAHRTGTMEDCVADLAVGTVPPHRRKGYAKTVLSALVGYFTDRGGQAIYNCSPENHASIATAHSAGFVPFGRSLILSAPRAD